MYDLAIIGAGWAGFNAALKASKCGLTVALIDKSEIGGTCLNLGCIPTKTLIQSAKVFNLVKKAALFGIDSALPEADLNRVQERKEKIVEQLRAGMRSMLRDIEFISGEARLASRTEIKISAKTVSAKNILIASGSQPHELPQFKFDGQKIISSNEALALKSVPASLLIIGGGVIGCEFAGLFASFGSRVTVAEKMPQLLPGEDKEAAKKLEAVFKKKGIRVNTAVEAAGLNIADFERVLVCVGRRPRTEGLGLEELGLRTEQARIITDEYLRTNIDNIYAAGDCASKIMLAHYAGWQGRLAGENIAFPGRRKSAGSAVIPNCIFTDPEMGSVGLSEEKALAAGLDIAAHKFDFTGSGMARILDEADGFIKVIADRRSGKVYGGSIIGPKATELIGILTLAVTHSLSIEDLRQTIFAHPTLSETITQSLE